MNICIVGTGYVGLVTGACFAEMGNHVWCVDLDTEKIAGLKAGVMPIYEPGLKEMVIRNSQEGRLFFTSSLKEGLSDALFCFIAVGTPPQEDGAADLSAVQAVAQAIGKIVDQYLIVVNKSTVPVGTADLVKSIIRQELKARGMESLEVDVVSNPEFLKEGAAIEDFLRPDRVVIGSDNVRTLELMKRLYEPFVRNQNPIIGMDIRSAEITKYAANAMLALRISFINEIAGLCDAVGGDVAKVRLGIGTDSRIGMPFLYAGIGYGGSCFPKDVRELVTCGHRHGVPMNLVEMAHHVNERQKRYLLGLIDKRWGEDLSDKVFGIWGLAFKPQTDDMREAPSIIIINELVNRGATIKAFDPEAFEEAKKIFYCHGDKIQFSSNMLDAVQGVDSLMLLTEWHQFRQPNFTDLKQVMRQPIIFDGRNQYNPEQLQQLGFEYFCVGRNRYGK
ncbi:UDP-glucose/GDP-mannose dehydrogenase family protein [Desulfotomaculum defluvii]